ncbi:hypothetical protein BJ960_002649 [Leucobacter aridicollis]|uniref:Uncharacterized protein n=1 Tax=Leucobacter aridicollis TaxID=283878 RepID=A0A852REP6_9MICO|nr:hypothetical protein [Leucobacter aridicollis]NYD27846.1 hypothetical protein [Leucobacter aridicollis]
MSTRTPVRAVCSVDPFEDILRERGFWAASIDICRNGLCDGLAEPESTTQVAKQPSCSVKYFRDYCAFDSDSDAPCADNEGEAGRFVGDCEIGTHCIAH